MGKEYRLKYIYILYFLKKCIRKILYIWKKMCIIF
nr:MAG TPA: hypothetical protein [Caudoviricetes sp.]